MAEANNPNEEFLKTDTGRHPVMGGVTNDDNKNVKMLRVNATTLKLLVEAEIKDALSGYGLTIDATGALKVTALKAVNEATFQTNASGGTFLVLPTLSCLAIQVYNDSGTILEFSKNDNTATIKCFASTYCIIDGITNLNQLKVKRLDNSNTRVTVTYSILN